MTVGNSSSELLNTLENDLPQVSEFCLLVSKETRFLLLDVNWLYEIYTHKDEDMFSSLNNLTALFSFEDFLDQVLSNQDTSFIYEMISPAVEDNTLSDELHTKICCLGEQLYLDVHAKVCDSLVNSGLINEEDSGHDHLRLMGFFGTTAIIAFNESPAVKYPTFEEAYGHFGIKKWGDALSRNPILETIIPFIQGHYTKPNTF